MISAAGFFYKAKVHPNHDLFVYYLEQRQSQMGHVQVEMSRVTVRLTSNVQMITLYVILPREIVNVRLAILLSVVFAKKVSITFMPLKLRSVLIRHKFMFKFLMLLIYYTIWTNKSLKVKLIQRSINLLALQIKDTQKIILQI